MVATIRNFLINFGYIFMAWLIDKIATFGKNIPVIVERQMYLQRVTSKTPKEVSCRDSKNYYLLLSDQQNSDTLRMPIILNNRLRTF